MSTFLFAILLIQSGAMGMLQGDIYEPNFQEWCEQVPLDVVLVMDSSGSVELTFNSYRDTASRLIRLLPIGDQASHVTVLQYSNQTNTLLSFSSDPTEVRRTLDTVQFLGSTTETAQAVNEGVRQLKDNGRPDASRLFILMTDGNSNNKWIDVLSAADLVNSIGATVVVVAYGNSIYWPEIEAYAGGNSSAFTESQVEHMFSLIMDTTGRVCRNTRSPDEQCVSPLDIQLVVDSSESVEESFNFYKRSAAELANALSIGAQAALFGIVQYSREATIRLALSVEQSNNDVLQTIDSMQYIGATTKTADALTVALQSLVEFDRPSTTMAGRKVLILMTDGHSFDGWDRVVQTANNLRQSGVTRIVLAAGKSLGEAELQEYVKEGGILIRGEYIGDLSTLLMQMASSCDQH